MAQVNKECSSSYPGLSLLNFYIMVPLNWTPTVNLVRLLQSGEVNRPLHLNLTFA